MTKHVATITTIGAVLAAGALAFAGPAVADDEGSLEMPDVSGMSLEAAQSEVAGLSEDVEIPTASTDMNGMARQQLSPANWTVCATAPGAGDSFLPEEGVLFGVVRRGLESCG